MQERSSGDQGEIHTSPPDTDIVLTGTYNGKRNKEEKRSHGDSRS